MLWTSDPGLIGTPDLEVRQVTGEGAPVDACADGFTARRTLSEELSVNDPVGAADRLLLLVHPDGAGALTSLQFTDMSTGKAVRTVTVHWEKGVDLTRSAAGVAATYWKALGTLPCVPVPGAKDCWEKIVEARRDLPLANLPAPDCGPALKAWRWKTAPTPSELQIAVKVRDALGSSRLEVMPAAPTCDFAD